MGLIDERARLDSAGDSVRVCENGRRLWHAQGRACRVYGAVFTYTSLGSTCLYACAAHSPQ